MVIESPELQTEVREFLKDRTKSYTEILEEIHADYQVQTAGEDIQGVLGGATANITLTRRGIVKRSKTKREVRVEKA